MATAARAPRPLYKDLSVQILVAMVLGVIVGYLWPKSADTWRPLGDLFVIYNHNVRERLDRWALDSNQLLVKLQYAFRY